MNESFGDPLDPPREPFAGPVTKNAEGEAVSRVEAPEFNPDRIDREKLRTAIEIAQAEEGIASKRFAENHDKQIEGMNEEELRKEIERAERSGDEAEVLRLEELILNREKEGTVESVEQEEGVADSPVTPEETTQATEDVSPVREEVVSEKNERRGTYAERLSALAQEKDPLGLARVALREALEELGTTEVPYMKAGPFEELVAADKLDVVREFEAFKEKTGKNNRVSGSDLAIHLKGLIYSKFEQKPVKVEEQISHGTVSDAKVGEPIESETSENASKGPMAEPLQKSESEAPVVSSEEADTPEIPQEQPQDKTQEQEEEPVPSTATESFEVEESTSAELIEMKESGLLARVLQSFREAVRSGLENAENRADDTKIDQVMNLIDQNEKALFSEGEKSIEAQAYLSKLLHIFLAEADLSEEEQRPYKKVLSALSRDKSAHSLDQAA